ncbi:cellulose binding domain-containing protein, partial [Streptomyces sp. NPDC055051]
MSTPRTTSRTMGRSTRAALALTALVGSAALATFPLTTASASGSGVVVQYRTSASGATADQSEPWLKVRNTGTSAVQLSQVKIRYYFKADSPNATYRFACSWAVKGCSVITGTFGTLANPTANADRYLEIGFT